MQQHVGFASFSSIIWKNFRVQKKKIIISCNFSQIVAIFTTFLVLAVSSRLFYSYILLGTLPIHVVTLPWQYETWYTRLYGISPYKASRSKHKTPPGGISTICSTRRHFHHTWTYKSCKPIHPHSIVILVYAGNLSRYYYSLFSSKYSLDYPGR